ncbi:hypothetical protein [Chitiniphilus shinanonensis]|uniref:hypothetical protein n=1 Tax=Chitiniphilus shinanonensis TaxID=553088 RepID=UPI0012F8C5C3|nr:hypothetical protein [Chitiniphilus shinanonensis]
MKSAIDHRDEFVKSIAHIRSAASKVIANSGPTKPLSAPDVHKIAEGLFLSAVTHWEELCQVLLITDLATQTGSLLKKDVKSFRTKNAPLRLAESMLSHIDHPNSFYDWSDFNRIAQRANAFLAPGHRFSPPPPLPPGAPLQSTALLSTVVNELAMFKRLRNSVAHKSDKAWDSFIKLISAPPFSLTTNQRKGVTPGRFLVTQQWAGKVVLHHALDTLENAAFALVP